MGIALVFIGMLIALSSVGLAVYLTRSDRPRPSVWQAVPSLASVAGAAVIAVGCTLMSGLDVVTVIAWALVLVAAVAIGRYALLLWNIDHAGDH